MIIQYKRSWLVGVMLFLFLFIVNVLWEKFYNYENITSELIYNSFGVLVFYFIFILILIFISSKITKNKNWSFGKRGFFIGITWGFLLVFDASFILKVLEKINIYNFRTIEGGAVFLVWISLFIFSALLGHIIGLIIEKRK